MQDLIQAVIIDDNPGSLELLTAALSRNGVTIHTAADPIAGLELVRRFRPCLVITDLVMPGLTGLDVLRKVMEIDPSIDVILMTAYYTTETAVEAIRNGAADYLQKPVKIAALRERVANLLGSAEKRRRAFSSPSANSQDYQFEGLIARSSSMWDLFGLIGKVAPHFRSILIQGSTGSGKDLIAHALHHASGVKGRFIILNCSAIVESLFESELFGYSRGAFTGADREKAGLFEAADGGTLFLDEIGDMPLNTQAKLLRAVQNQEIQRVGALSTIRVNVRVIAATHRDLKQAVRDGVFREDLYYRLSMVQLSVPPLRERPEDISLLANHFLRQFSREYQKSIHGISRRALLLLERYPWPGNVRELEHVIGRACMLANTDTIDVGDLPPELIGDIASEISPSTSSILEDQERSLVEQVFRETNRNQSETARRLKIGRDALRYKLKKYHLCD